MKAVTLWLVRSRLAGMLSVESCQYSGVKWGRKRRSVECGIPTFRESQTGLWAKYSPEELATPQAFRRNPKLVWEWYAWRRELVSNAQPNPGHLALAELEQLVPQFTLITQNVDGLHFGFDCLGLAGTKIILSNCGILSHAGPEPGRKYLSRNYRLQFTGNHG